MMTQINDIGFYYGNGIGCVNLTINQPKSLKAKFKNSN
jgi:hypothetical protein